MLIAVPAAAQADTQSGPDATLAQTHSAPENTQVGQKITLTVTIDHPVDTQVVPPESFDQGRWEIVNSSSVETPAESRIKTVWTLDYAVFRPGTTTLQPLEFLVMAPGDDANATPLKTEPVDVKVLTTWPDDTEPAFSEPQPAGSIWVDDYTLAYVGGGLAGVALLALGVWGWRRRREDAIEIYVPPPPPHEVALTKLGALAGSDLMERGQFMIYYVRLSEAVREYLGKIYGFPGTELTTYEIEQRLEGVKFPRGVAAEDIVSLLQHCDFVKFGGVEPTISQSTDALRRAFSIVELTKPKPFYPPKEDSTSTGSVAVDTAADDEKQAVEASPWAPKEEE